MADQGRPQPEAGAGVDAYTFRLWGRFSARRNSDGAEVTPRGRKARALLAILLVEQEAVSRERLAGLLWSERGQAQAFGSLRTCLLDLRDFPGLLRIERHQVAADLEHARTDLAAIADTAAAGDAAGLADLLAGGAAALLEDLDGIDPAFDEWLVSARATQSGKLVERAQACARAALDAGRYDTATRLARTLFEIDPLDEETARLAMEAADRAGKVDAVQRIHDRLVTGLRQELGVAPSPETEALRDRLAHPGRPAAAAVAAADAPAADPARRQVVATRWWRRRNLVAAAAGLLLLLAASVAAWQFLGRRPAAAEPVSIAVLPFRNLAAGDSYFAEGVAEEILTQLARQPGLRVAGRTSSWMFRDSADPRDVGRRLDVAYLLEGSVRQAGRQVRVDVALVDTSDGMRRWSDTFPGTLDDIFTIQGRVGNAVVGQLRQRIAASQPVPRPLRTRGDVYNLYLTARALIRQRTPAKLETAVILLRRAVALDPNYAPAVSRLGVAIHMSCSYGNCDPSQHDAEALRHAEQALALAPDFAPAHAAIALIRDFDRASIPHLERANRLDPNDPEIWYWLYIARSQQLDYEGALEAARQATIIDPFFRFNSWYADLAFNMGERGQAIRYWRMIAARHPNAHQRSIARFSNAFYHNDLSEAFRHAHEGTALASPDEAAYSHRREAFVLIRLGLVEQARRLGDLPPPFVAMIGGEAPAIESFSNIPLPFWEMEEMRLMLPRLLLKAGRGRDLVALYDRAFRSPDDMAARHPRMRHDGLGVLVEDAANVAIALREAGRGAEADRLLALAGRMIDRTMRRARVPLRFKANAASVWAVQGRRDAALAALDEVLRAGWRWQSTSAPVYLADQPAFRSLRNDARLRRWDAMMRAELARERRELLATGLVS